MLTKVNDFLFASTFEDACAVLGVLDKLSLSTIFRSQLNSGSVFFVFWTLGNTCWPYFPVGQNRDIVKMLRTYVELPKGVKVIVEIDPTNFKEVENYMLDCFGHTLLYLHDRKASNECKDALKFAEDNSITLIQK